MTGKVMVPMKRSIVIGLGLVIGLVLSACAGESAHIVERSGDITLEGAPLTLVGPELKVGQKAPDFRLPTPVDSVEAMPDVREVTLADSRGKITLLNIVPSLDTPVCDFSTRKFEEEANKYKEAVFYAVSMDLPFAQARYCGTAEIETLTTLSDYRDASFGLAYGMLIKELRLLTRAVVIIDAEGTVQYIEYVKEISEHPDYEKALSALRTMLGESATRIGEPVPIVVGSPAPDFQLENLNGELVSLSDFRGQPVLLNFWATWCPFCRAERPWIQEIHDTWQDKGLVVLTVDLIGAGPSRLATTETPDNLKEFMQSNGYSFPVLLDANQELLKTYNISATPTNVFIDKDGIIRQVHVGLFASKDEMEASLSNILP